MDSAVQSCQLDRDDIIWLAKRALLAVPTPSIATQVRLMRPVPRIAVCRIWEVWVYLIGSSRCKLHLML